MTNIKKCECQFCKLNVYKYFCSSCFSNFNECESFFEFFDVLHGDLPQIGSCLCPKCFPEDFKPKIKNIKIRER